MGQTGMAATQVNQGGAPNANTLDLPTFVGAGVDGTRPFSSRTQVITACLSSNSIPNSTDTPADVVIGQPNMGATQINQGLGSPTSQTLDQPTGVWADEGRVYISDFSNNRVLVYNSIPVTNNAPADAVLGQPVFTTSTFNQGTLQVRVEIRCTTLFQSFTDRENFS